MNWKKWVIYGFAVVLLSLPLVGVAHAEEKKGPWEKFNIKLGAFVTDSDSTVRVGLPGVGISIDPEEALGVDSSTTVFRFDGFWRFTGSRRHRLDFGWSGFRRRGTRTLGRDLEIGGEVIKLGTTINTAVDYDIYRVGYSYSFFQDDRIDLAVSGGLYVLPISFEFEAEGLASGTIAEGITAPLPLVGLRADFAVTPKVFLRSKADIFYLEFDSFSGSVVDVQFGVEWLPFKHVGFGASLESIQVEVESKDEVYPGSNFVGNIGIDATGLMLYTKFFF